MPIILLIGWEMTSKGLCYFYTYAFRSQSQLTSCHLASTPLQSDKLRRIACKDQLSEGQICVYYRVYGELLYIHDFAAFIRVN